MVALVAKLVQTIALLVLHLATGATGQRGFFNGRGGVVAQSGRALPRGEAAGSNPAHTVQLKLDAANPAHARLFLGEVMKKIPLTQGKYAIVDDENYEWLSQWRWYAHKMSNSFYAERKQGGEDIFMHREILGLTKGDKRHTDHKNHNGLDNRLSNIRTCSIAQNQHNQKPRKVTSCYKGVCWYKRKNKWNARIGKDHKNYHLGYYKTEEKAARAYDKKAKELFGEFACLNFPKNKIV